MKKFLVITLMAGALTAQAQTSTTATAGNKGFLKTLDLSLNVGTSGIGFDLATPISDMFQVRVGYEFMPPFHVGIDFPIEVGGEPAEKYDANGNRVESLRRSTMRMAIVLRAASIDLPRTSRR